MDIAINNALIPDFTKLTFYRGNVGIKNGVIAKISGNPIEASTVVDAKGSYLTPGLIDCHCHIESTHLTPMGFANAAAQFGTLHVVADCHEIANVAGIEGVNYFINEARKSPINIRLAIPSCVPATEFATSGGRIEPSDVETLLKNETTVALGELMNVLGVVNGEKKFLEMIELTKRAGKRVNGHAPHLTPNILKKYRERGAEDDHESYTYEELKQKIELGFFVFIREGSSEFTENEAYKVIKEYPDRVAFCTDDKSIGDILNSGHINFNIKKAIKNGINPILALKTATYNGLNYYGLSNYSEVKINNKAYLVIFNKNFDAKKIIINGEISSSVEPGKIEIPEKLKNSIKVKKPITLPKIDVKDIAIGVNDGSLITEKLQIVPQKGEFNIQKDILKLVVIERYGHGFKSACYIHGFGLRKGALATSLAHDCHNIVALGTNDNSIKKAIEKVIEIEGGQVVFDGENFTLMPLEIGGIVTKETPVNVTEKVERLKKAARSLGCKLTNPFDTLSFMALEVIPHLKLTDRGLFDVDNFSYVREKNV